MHYYIIRKGQEYIIYRVKLDDDESFREKYKTDIVVDGDSLVQVLLRFEQEIMFSLDYVTDLVNFGHLKGT